MSLAECIDGKEWNTAKEDFKKISEGIYPADCLARMKNDSYNPLIIGYLHDIELNKFIKMRCMQAFTKQDCHIGIELLPDTLDWAKEFIKETEEYLKSHTPADQEYNNYVKKMNVYLTQSQNFDLAVWLLKNNFKVSAIESPEMPRWKKETENDAELWAEICTRFRISAKEGLLYYKGIQRDIYNLRKINELRPDVVCIGSAHALVYDMLLDRDGKNSFYLPESQAAIGIRQMLLLRGVHEIYHNNLYNASQRSKNNAAALPDTEQHPKLYERDD